MSNHDYELLKWLEDLALKAHNHEANSVTEHGRHGYQKEKEAYNRVINYIQTMGKPAAPYMHENQAGENRWTKKP